MAVNPVTYVKNVGKSFGYVALDVLGSTSPVMKDMIDSNKDTISSLYSEIKNFSSSPMEKIRNNQKIMSYSNDIKSGFQNLASDLKTGTFYNAARQNDAMNAAMGIDFDFDSMFDDIDLDFDEKSLNSDTKAAAAIADGSTKEILAMDVVGSRVATAVGTATAKSAEYIVNANAESTRAVLNQNSKIFSAISTGMIGINKTLGDIVKLSQPLTEHMQNSVTFYTKSTENQLKMIELLERIDNNTKMPEPKKGSGGKRYSGIEDYLGAGFGLDLGKLSGKVKGNFKNAFESTTFGMLLSMNDMFGEGTMTKMFASNPLGFIMPMVIEGTVMTPKLKKSLSQLSDALGAASLKMMRDLKKQKNSSSGIMSFIAELFGYDEGVSKRKYTGEYEKGPVPFDGVTRQAIIKVIPEYLSMILKAVSGGEQRYYDYKNGKFITTSQIEAKKKADEMYTIDKLGVDAKLGATTFNDASNKGFNKKDVEKAVDQYIRHNLNVKGTPDYIYPDTRKTKNFKKYGFSDEKYFNAFMECVVYTRNGDNRFGIEYLNARINAERNYRGNNPYNEFDIETYLEDSSYFEGSIGYGQSRSRESETKGSSGGSKKGSSSEEGPRQRLTAKRVREKLKAAGYDETSSTYKKMVKEFESYGSMSNNEKEKYREKLDKISSPSGASTKAQVKVEEVLNSVQKFFDAPMAAVANMIDKGSTAIYNLLYGKEGEEGEKSILGHIFTNMKDMFTQFKDWSKKEIFDPIKKYISDRGGIKKMFMDFFGIDDTKFQNFKNEFKEKASKVGKDVGSRFRSAGRWMWDNSPVVQAVRNRRGSGSGLVGGASETAGFGRQVYDETIGGLKRFLSAILPDKKDLNKDFSKIGDVTKDALSELKLDPSGAITGALIGTGVSILTGGIVGPFLAASIGGAAGLTINSKVVQKALFGEDIEVTDKETGEKVIKHEAGLLSDKMTKFLTQDLKKMGAYGATGAVLSMIPGIPGGPLTGILVGSALGFANREGQLSNYLFGEVGEDGKRQGGVVSKELQDKIKHLLPKAAAGAILGLVAGPFGLVPNIMVGAGLGFASETEKFKTILFGEEVEETGPDGKVIKVRKGGITGWIRNDIIKPVANAIQPIASELAHRGKSFIRGLGNKLTNMINNAIFMPLHKKILEYILTPLGKALKKPAEFLGGIISSPFRAIGAVGRHLKNVQVSRGRAGYMSASERLKYRETLDYKNRDKFGNKINSFLFGTKGQSMIDSSVEFDTALAGMDEEELNSILTRMKEAKSVYRRSQTTRKSRFKELSKFIEDAFSVRAANVFEKAYKRYNEFDLAYSALNEYCKRNGLTEPTGIPEATRVIIKNLYDSYAESNKLMFGASADEEAAIKEIQDKLKLSGISSMENIDTYLDTVKSELRYRQGGTAAAKLDPVTIQTNLIKAQTDKTNAHLVDINNTLRRIVGLKPIPGGTVDYARTHHDIRDIVDDAVSGAPKVSDGWNAFQKFYGKEASSKWAEAKAKSGQGSRLAKWFGRGALVGGAAGLFGIMKTKVDSQGQEALDMADKETRASIKLRDDFFGTFKDIKDYVKGIFGKIEEGEDPEAKEEEKKSFLESLFEGITGENGLLGGLLSWFGGTTLGRWASTFFSKLPTMGTLFSGLITGAIGGALLKFGKEGITGNLDNWAYEKGIADRGKDLTANQGVGSGADYTNWSGTTADGRIEAAATDENGNPIIDENGNVLSTNGNILYGVQYNAGQGTFQQKMIGNTARSLITGTGVIRSGARLVGKGIDSITKGFVKGGLASAIGRNTIGRVGTAITTGIGNKLASNAVRGLGEAAKSALVFGGAGDVIGTALLDPDTGQVYKVFNALKKLPILRNFEGPLEQMANSLSETLAKKLAGKSAMEVGKSVLSFAAFAAKLALIAIDFEEGYKHAQRTLGIKKPSAMQKILSGIIRVVKNLIPIVGTLIPDKVVVDLFVKILAPIFGINTSDFLKAQSDAADELAEYNEANGTNLNWDEYVQQVGRTEGWGEQTWGEGIKAGAKNAWLGIKTGTTKLGAGVKKVGTAISTGWGNFKQGAANTWGAIKAGTAAAGEKVSEMFHKVFDPVGNLISAITKSAGDLTKIIVSGNMLHWLNYQPMKHADEDNPLGGILHGIVFGEKLLALPLTGISWIGHKVGDYISGVFKKAQTQINNTKQINRQINSYIIPGDVEGLNNFDIDSHIPEDTPLSGVLRTMANGEKAFAYILTNISAGMHRVGEYFSDTFRKVSSQIDLTRSINSEIHSYIMPGDWSGLTNFDIDSKIPEDTPLSGLLRATLGANKFFTYIPTGISWGLHRVGEFFSNIMDKGSSVLDTIRLNDTNLDGFVSSGDLAGLKDYTITTEDGGPVSGVAKVVGFIQKMLAYPGTAVHYGINVLSDGIKSKLNSIKTAKANLDNVINRMDEKATAGDLAGVQGIDMDTEFPHNGGMLNGVFRLIGGITKAFYTVKAIMYGIVEKVANSKLGKFITRLWNGSDNEDEALDAGSSGIRGGSFVSQLDPSVSTRRFGSSTIGANGCAPSVASMITGMPLDQTASYAMRRGYANRKGTSADYFGNVLSSAGIPAEYVYTGAGSAQDYLASRIAGGSPTVLLGQDPYNTSKAYSPFGPGNHYVLATGMTNDGGVIVQDPESRTPNNVYDKSILNNVKLGIPTGRGSGLRRLIRRFRGGDSYVWVGGEEDQWMREGNVSDRGYSSSTDGMSSTVLNSSASSQQALAYAQHTGTYTPGPTKTGSSNTGGTRDMSYEAQRKAIEAAQGKVTNQFEATGKALAKAQSAHGYAGSLSLDHQQIWTYLVRKGLSEEGAAALMGCWQAESGNHPNRIEGDYMGSFPGFDAVASSQATMDNYVENILWPATEKNVSINRAAYRGNDGHLYPGFGLAQWTGKRAEKLLSFANSKGLDWKSLGCQLDFAMSELSSTYSSVLTSLQNGGDIAELTKIVFNKYEGCKKEDWLRKRQEYAAMIYQEFTGKTFSMPGYDIGSTSTSSSTNVTDKSGSGKKASILDFGSMFGQLIAARFGKLGELFGLSTGSSEDELSSGYGLGEDSNAESSGFAGTDNWRTVVNATTGEPNSSQRALVDKMKSIEGTLAYSMNGPRDPDQGSADCSSTVNWAYSKVLGDTIGSTTLGIMQSGKMSTIDMSDMPESGGTGSGPNLNRLMPGDLVLLSRPTSDFTSGRPFRVGHVEMYMGDGKTIGHGSNNGPKVRDIEKDKYIMARRYNSFINSSAMPQPVGGTRDMSWAAEQAARASVKDNAYGTVTSTGIAIVDPSKSRDMSWEAEQKARAAAGSGSGLVYNIAQDGINTVNRRHRASRSAFGGSSGLVNLSKYSSSRKSKYYNDLRKLRGSGMIDDAADKELMISLIKAIISLLSNVSANSDKIGQIANALGSLAAKSGNNGLAGSGLDTLSNNLGIQDTDTTIREMQQLLNNLASGQ